MRNIKDLNKELIAINSAIDENYNSLIRYNVIVNQAGGYIDAEWNVVPSTINLSIAKNVLILGIKTKELIAKREILWKNFLESCKNKRKSELKRATELDIPDWYIEKLEDDCIKMSDVNILNALEFLKKRIDEIEQIIKQKSPAEYPSRRSHH
jgi:hypothetical protein